MQKKRIKSCLVAIVGHPPKNALYHTVQMVLVDHCDKLIICFLWVLKSGKNNYWWHRKSSDTPELYYIMNEQPLTGDLMFILVYYILAAPYRCDTRLDGPMAILAIFGHLWHSGHPAVCK